MHVSQAVHSTYLARANPMRTRAAAWVRTAVAMLVRTLDRLNRVEDDVARAALGVAASDVLLMRRIMDP